MLRSVDKRSSSWKLRLISALYSFQFLAHQRNLAPEDEGWQTLLIVDSGHACLPVSAAAPGLLCVLKLASMSTLHLSNLFDEYSSHMFLNFVHSIQLRAVLWAELESVKVRGNSSSQMLVYLLVIEVEGLESLEEVQELLLDE